MIAVRVRAARKQATRQSLLAQARELFAAYLVALIEGLGEKGPSPRRPLAASGRLPILRAAAGPSAEAGFADVKCRNVGTPVERFFAFSGTRR